MSLPTFKYFSGTKAVRVPVEIADDLMALAKTLDLYKGKKGKNSDALPPSEFIQDTIKNVASTL